MPPPPIPSDATPSQLRLHVSNTVVARVAAYYACQVPGVLRLHPDRAHPMASVAVVDDGRAEISLALATQWGRNCRHIAEAVRDHVAEQVRAYTGLSTTVSVTVTDVDYDATQSA